MPSTINASNSGSGGLISAGDASGVLALQTAGTTAITVDASQNTTFAGKVTSAGALTLASNGTTTAVTIDTSQNVLVGTTTSSIYNQNTVNGISLGTSTSVPAIQVATDPAGATGNACLLLNMRNTPINGAKYLRTFYNGTTETGSISLSGTSNVLYNISSDYRLKNNPVPITGAKEFVMALQPKTWDWWDNSGKGVGFIAHEFMEIAKYSGNGEKDAVDADGKPIHQSIQPSSPEVMANIVALMQEQQATITAQAETINALTARIVALEGK